MYIYIYTHHIFFIHSFIYEHLVCFQVLAIVNSVAINIGLHVSFWIVVFSKYIPRSGITGSYDNSIFSFQSNFHMVLYSDCTNLHPTNSVGGFQEDKRAEVHLISGKKSPESRITDF